MGSNHRQPPDSDAATLASLTIEHFQGPIARSQEQTRSENIRSRVRSGWVIARQSRIPSRAWNRQSCVLQNFILERIANIRYLEDFESVWWWGNGRSGTYDFHLTLWLHHLGGCKASTPGQSRWSRPLPSSGTVPTQMRVAAREQYERLVLQEPPHRRWTRRSSRPVAAVAAHWVPWGLWGCITFPDNQYSETWMHEPWIACRAGRHAGWAQGLDRR